MGRAEKGQQPVTEGGIGYMDENWVTCLIKKREVGSMYMLKLTEGLLYVSEGVYNPSQALAITLKNNMHSYLRKA